MRVGEAMAVLERNRLQRLHFVRLETVILKPP
jgi:hypothetical protein